MLAVAGCVGGDTDSSPSNAPPVSESAGGVEGLLAPYALTYEVVDEGLAAQAAELDTSVYVAAPLLTTGTQAVLELRGDLAPLTLLDASGSTLAALTATDDSLVGLSRACLSDSGGYAFCARIATFEGGGVAIDEATESLDLDHHAVEPDADGAGFWADRYVPVECGDDVYPCGLGDEPLERIYDCEVVHVRDGEAVWEWSALEHFTDAMLDTAATTAVYAPVDPFHCNSVQPSDDGATVYVSMRHPSTVMAIDVATGDILWTFGHDDSALALAVDDPADLLGDRPVLNGQHDFRWLGGDRFSVFDNGSGGVGTARFVVLSVTDGTATIENVVEDPSGRESRCTGSARPMDADETFWAVSWGCSESGVSVVTADGREVARLTVDLDAGIEQEILTDVAAEQPELGHTVGYQAVVGRPGLLG
ncbi:arylsulfotransferase family protein [Demequina sp. SYSU T00192]|uniref:Arylsulfotransferase family protein n=1 Tax=Demequina litoralis TaxID=3051660 RepID=A0ABT8GCH4_9MICO|nr:aryl-sulfate sulfotransferase [Demequina sp. SYSU T00192]MDN4476834.1 arylsulfotransferase family protein [Demequina sp. SYSU T00192]